MYSNILFGFALTWLGSGKNVINPANDSDNNSFTSFLSSCPNKISLFLFIKSLVAPATLIVLLVSIDASANSLEPLIEDKPPTEATWFNFFEEFPSEISSFKIG